MAAETPSKNMPRRLADPVVGQGRRDDTEDNRAKDGWTEDDILPVQPISDEPVSDELVSDELVSDEMGWRAEFLACLRMTGNVSAAARSAGRCRSACYEVRRRDPAFAASWADAIEEAVDRLELEALRRAVEGVAEDRFFRGAAVGQITRYSDNLLMFLLKARRPASFGRAGVDRHTKGDSRHPDGESDAQIMAELRRRMARLSAQAEPEPD